MTVVLRPTAALEPADLREIRRLVDLAFAGDFDDDDWAHALGGLHAVVRDDDGVVAHGAVVERQLLLDGRPVRTGYVEAVAVHPAHRRRGHAAAVMATLETAIRDRYELGALGATDDGAALYRARGWQAWWGTTWASTPEGRIRTSEDDDAVFVLAVAAPLDLSGELV
ncbi:MAG TPA: GNAT family N-acetyltransferase, partial [Blastococcus sp.]|nr:GNAT family N-acetyltransferase [Blastococcus sp.]